MKKTMTEFEAEKFISRKGDLQPIAPEDIKNKSSLYYKIFGDSNDKKGKEQNNDEK